MLSDVEMPFVIGVAVIDKGVFFFTFKESLLPEKLISFFEKGVVTVPASFTGQEIMVEKSSDSTEIIQRDKGGYNDCKESEGGQAGNCNVILSSFVMSKDSW